MGTKAERLDPADRIQTYLTYFLRLTLIIAVVVGAYNQRWTLVFTTSLIFLLTYLPAMIERRYRIYLPIEFEFIIILFIYASLFLGEIRSYYLRYWWWDILLHTSSGVAIGFAGFLILFVLYHKDKINAKPGWLAAFSFCFAVAIGAIWEIFEFAMDQSFGLNMQKSGLVDTMWDLIVDSLGALLTSFVGYFYLRGKKTPLFHRLFSKFRGENPRYFKHRR